MKILFVWTGVTSYMADCWRELQQQEGVELKILIEAVESGREFKAAEVLSGLDYEIAEGVKENNWIGKFDGWKPDIIFAVGWHSRLVRTTVENSVWKNVPKVCAFDLPWRWKLRCIAAKFVLGPWLKNYDAAYVPGVACERYAKWLGFRRIYKGLFSIDCKKFEHDGARSEGFLYVGRFSEEKRLDDLLKGYARYRELGGRLGLDCVGGDAAKLMKVSGIERLPEGVRALGFVQPAEIPRLYSTHKALVLTSEFDPWPLVVLQACANGMKIVMSSHCTNRFELIRDNGYVFKTGDKEAIANAMLNIDMLKGEVGIELSKQYDKRVWCERTLRICKEVRG